MKKVIYKDEVMKYVNFWIPQKYIDMIDELSCKYANGNRTQMLIKLIEAKDKEDRIANKTRNK
jgi:hypothetical protein